MDDSSVLGTVAFFKKLRWTLEELTDEEAGRFMKALFAHADGEDVNPFENDRGMRLVFAMVADETDRLAEKREKRSRSGYAGGSKQKQSEANGSKAKQTEASEKQNGAQYQNQSQNQNQSQSQDHSQNQTSPDGDERKAPSGPKESALAAGAPELDTDFVREAWAAYVEMRRKIKKPMTAAAERLAVKTLKDLSRGDPIRAVKIIEQSVFNSWQGLFDLKAEKGGRVDWSAV